MKQTHHLKQLEHFQAYSPTAAGLLKASARVHGAVDPLPDRSRTVGWICGGIAAAIMVETLFFKFTGSPESIYIFSKMGTEPWMRWVQGIWELLASICLLWPRMKWAGGILTTGAMLAAILSHMTWLGYSIQGDHGLLFGMALLTFTCGVTVLWLYRHQIPGYVPTTTY